MFPKIRFNDMFVLSVLLYNLPLPQFCLADCSHAVLCSSKICTIFNFPTKILWGFKHQMSFPMARFCVIILHQIIWISLRLLWKQHRQFLDWPNLLIIELIRESIKGKYISPSELVGFVCLILLHIWVSFGTEDSSSRILCSPSGRLIRLRRTELIIPLPPVQVSAR